MAESMKVIARPDAIRLIQEHGGALYVWTELRRCCSGGMTLLKTAAKPPGRRSFERFDAPGFELWFDPGSRTPPSELHVDARGWKRKRVEAYWNGCAFAI